MSLDGDSRTGTGPEGADAATEAPSPAAARSAGGDRPAWRRVLPWAPLILVVAVSAGLYFHDLDHAPGLVFDEHHYVSASRQIANGVWMDQCWAEAGHPHRPVNWEHPPLAKLIMAGSMKLFDDDLYVFEGCRAPNDEEHGGKERYDAYKERVKEQGNPYAWRGPSALMGTLAVAGIGLAAARLFRSPAAGALAGGLVLMDNMVLAMSRLALLDIYAAGFAALGLAFALQPTRTGRVLGPLLLGLGFACKYPVAFVGPAVLAAALYVHHRDGLLTRRRLWGQVAAYPLVPLGVLLAAYGPWWPRWLSALGFQGTLRNLAEFTGGSVRWGTTGAFEHSAATPPRDWLPMVRPTYVYVGEATAEGARPYIFALGNPVVWWTGAAAAAFLVALLLLAFVSVSYQARRAQLEGRSIMDAARQAWQHGTGGLRDLMASSLPFAFAYGGFLVLPGRTTFLFYMAFVSPFLALPLAGVLVRAWRQGGGLASAAGVALLLLAAAAFVHYFPVTFPLGVTGARLDAIMDAVPWMENPAA